MLGVNHVQVEMSERAFQTGLPWNRWEPESVVNQLRVSTQEWRSGSEPCRECVPAPYQEEITYTLPRSRNRTQGRLLLFTSVRTLLQCLSDVFMIIWQDRRTHSLTYALYQINQSSLSHALFQCSKKQQSVLMRSVEGSQPPDESCPPAHDTLLSWRNTLILSPFPGRNHLQERNDMITDF